MKQGQLYNRILSETNIYNAIYSLESYVFEKGLLSEADLELLNKLSDKFDFTTISKVISDCKNLLEDILDDNSKLFDVQVFFKIKKDDNGSVVYRPIHTADLTTQICMVSLLNVLMFEDSYKDKDSQGINYRRLSDLSKLIPSNFYGNIPSVIPEKLFFDWKSKYKEYSDAVIKKYYNYSETHQYSHEVCLDIKEFYPNINPLYLYEYITDKLMPGFEESDTKCLKIAVSKLLYFNLTNLLQDWEQTYYPEGVNLVSSKVKPVRGIPQGLPQAYFFGNLCMIELSKCISKHIPGDACYYVDDSVIYTKESNINIDLLNIELSKIKWSNSSKVEKPCISEFILELHDSLRYKICVHPIGAKTTVSKLKEAYTGLSMLRFIAGLTSNVNNAIFLSIDEVEDATVSNKINSILEAIDKGIKSINNQENDKSEQYYKKLLIRYKKFFTFRLKLIDDRTDPIDNVDEFLKKYGIGKKDNRLRFFKLYEEDIFYAELHLLIDRLDAKSRNTLIEQVKNFDFRLSKKSNEPLHLSKDISGVVSPSKKKNLKYKSLIDWAEDKYKRQDKLSDDKLIQRLNSVSAILENFDLINDYPYCHFVFDTSNELKRMILNSSYSRVINVHTSDELVFQKRDNRSLQYFELRLLLWLRNNKFRATEFISFARNLIDESTNNTGANIIDYHLFEVLHIFIAKVKSPKDVDSLVLVHKLVNGLWKNGSKFLHFYTLHNEEHSIELIKNIVRLVNTIDYLSIKQQDYYILFLACYLHDISMVIHPNLNKFCSATIESDLIFNEWITEINGSTKALDLHSKSDLKNTLVKYFRLIFDYFEDNVRNNHACDSAKFIIDRSDSSYFAHIDNAILQVVAKISESHGYDSVEVYGRKSFARSEHHSIKYMMVLIRLADLLDMSKDRVSYYIMKENIKHMSPVSQFHWISHLITDKCEIKANYQLENPERGVAFELKKGIIVETLQFNLYINIKNLTAIVPPKTGCDFYKCRLLSDRLEICINKDETNGCDKDKCLLLCRWITKKHEYLFNELFALKKYLETVNMGLFKTEIKVVVHFDNQRELEPEFSDIVIEYLN